MPSAKPQTIAAPAPAAPEKPKRGRDVTRTARQEDYLERLADAKGKRLVVDLDANGRMALEALMSAGYGTTRRDVVIRALCEAARKKVAKKI